VTFGETLEWQRCNSWEISRLATLGDKLACNLVSAYHRLYANRLDPVAQSEWMKYCDEFSRRDLYDGERLQLQNRFGHKLPPELIRKVLS